MKKENLSTKAYNYILQAILNNQFEMGDPISEVQISKSLDISRSPVREAIRQLEAEGIVESIATRGTFVRQFTIQDIYELFELRQLLEERALKDSYARLSKDVLVEMRSKIEQLDTDNVKAEDFYQMDRELHGLFINLCGNRRLIKFYHQLIVQIDVVRRISARNPNHFRVSKQFHLQILDALINNEPDKAMSVLRKHIENVQHQTEKVLMLNN